MRPSEAVAAYIEREAAQRRLTDGNRIPPIRRVAEDLEVSVRTVQSVFQKLARQGRIRTEVGKGTFWVAQPSRKREVLDIALGLHATAGAADELWSHQISSGILHAASQGSPRVKLLPLPHRLGDPSAAEDLLKECRMVDGLILFPSPFNREVRQAYEANGKPVVDLNPPSDTATANFVAPDYFGASRRIGRAWSETGRKQLLLMLHTTLERSSSNRARLAGLANGIGMRLGRGVALRMIPSESAREADGYLAMKKFLEGPDGHADAVYCVSDHQALGVLRAAQEHGLRVPEDLSLVGGTGLDYSTPLCQGLTRTQQPLRQIGEALLNLLRQRIREQRSAPSIILETPFIGGATTRPEENAILEIKP